MKIIRSISLAVALLVVSCQSKKSSDQVNNLENISKLYFEPDTFFKKAIATFETGDLEATHEQLENAIDFVKGAEIEGDTVYVEMLDFVLADLAEIQLSILDSAITDSEDLKELFAMTDISLSAYHLNMAQDWIGNNIEKKRSLLKALIRVEFALFHKGIMLNDTENQELIELKTEIVNAEQASLALWDKVMIKLESMNRKMDYPAIIFDEDIEE